MKNIEKFCDDLNWVWEKRKNFGVDINTNEPYICAEIKCEDCLFKDNCSEKSKVAWLFAEVPILDNVEKEYLENVFKPFKDHVVCVFKIQNIQFKYEQILFEMSDGDVLKLPKFRQGTMYKGIKDGEKYSLKDLGLYEE